jgi:DNA-binding response OmpR family regulator
MGRIGRDRLKRFNRKVRVVDLAKGKIWRVEQSISQEQLLIHPTIRPGGKRRHMSDASGVPTDTSQFSALVVEDDPAISFTVKRLLEREGFSVEVASQGSEAIDLCRQSEPDVILLDYELPDTNGQEVCRELRTFTDAYVVMLTANSADQNKIEAFAHGADDYITKPFSHKELTARLLSMMRRRRATTNDNGMRTYGPLSMDQARRRASVGDTALVLTRLEFELLDALMKDPGAVVSRSQLLRDVWKTEWTASDHLVEVHISNLRRKLTGAGLPSNSVLTVRGIGYRLSDPDAMSIATST